MLINYYGYKYLPSIGIYRSIENNPFTKPEQIDRFSDLAIEGFETDYVPCEKFMEWWEKIGFQKSIDKYFIGRVVNFKRRKPR